MIGTAIELVSPKPFPIDDTFKIEKAGIRFGNMVADLLESVILGGNQPLDQHIAGSGKRHFGCFHCKTSCKNIDRYLNLVL